MRMKKLLLPLVAAALGLSAAATEVTDVLTVESLKSHSNYSANSQSYANFTVTGQSGAEYALNCAHNKGAYIQLRASSSKQDPSGIVATTTPGKVVSVTVEWYSTTANGRTLNIYGNTSAYTLADLYASSAPQAAGTIVKGTSTSYTFTEMPEFVAMRSSSGAMYLSKISITWDVEGEAPVPTATRPVITCSDNTVTITAEEGAKIYYTTDETEPTDASTLYDAPFAITATTTVKAISYVEGKNPSPVASATCTFIDTYDGFAAVADLAANTNVIIEGPLTAVYQNGQNLYMVDSKGVAGLVYGSLTLKDIVNGDVFASLTGSISIYGGETQIKPVSLGARSTGTPVEPIVLTAVPDKDMAFKYAKIEGATVAGSATASGALQNFTITLADGTELTGRNNFKIDFEDGTNCTLTGFVNFYSGNAQFYPVTIQVGAVVETVETPVFSVAAGEVASGTLVSITCETAGAKIYYTTDGTAPSENSAEYTEPIAVEEDMTIKAIAVAEGMSNSAVATVAYTVLPAGTSVVNFNFASTTAADAVNNLTTDALEPEANNTSDGKGNLDGKVFTNGVIAMSVSKGGNTTTSGCPSWWTVPDGVRMYAENTANFYTVENNYKITKIEFSQASSSTAWSSVTATPGTLTGKVWESGEDDPVTDVKVTFGKASRFNNVKVYYEDAPGVTTGIEGIVVDENAPVEYFNLQGVRVANPENGLYIRRQGNQATKVLVK